ITFDTTAPTSAITVHGTGTYDANSWNSGGPIKGTATDNLSGVANVKVSVKDPSGKYWNGTAFVAGPEFLKDATFSNGTWSYPFDATDFVSGDGVYTIHSQATDKAGNVQSAGSGTVSITYNNVPPTSTITSPTNNTTYTSSAWDAASPIQGTDS